MLIATDWIDFMTCQFSETYDQENTRFVSIKCVTTVSNTFITGQIEISEIYDDSHIIHTT